jgi:hypothetical protein
MAILQTLPTEGQQAKAYFVPDDELAKFKQVETMSVEEGQAAPEGAENAQLIAGQDRGNMEQGDVQAYSAGYWCYYRMWDPSLGWHTMRGWRYRWQSCP